MSAIHILIQRWFSDGEGWAYSSELPPSLRMEVASQISQTANHFKGEVIERVIKIGGNKYDLFIRIEPDLNCLDEKARSRHPHIDIGILSQKTIPPSQREQCLIISKQITKRGEFLLSDVGFVNQNSGNEGSSASSSILLPLLLILLLTAYPAYLFLSAINRIPISPKEDNVAMDNGLSNNTLETTSTNVNNEENKHNGENQITLLSNLITEENPSLPENHNEDSNIVKIDNNNESASVQDLPSVELKTIDQWAENEIMVLEKSGLRLFDNKLKSDLLSVFITALNKSRVWRIEYNLSNKTSIESIFLEERFPHNEITYPNEVISEEDYLKFVKNICEELKIDSFEKITQYLNFKDFFKNFQFDKDNPLPDNRTSNEIRDFILQFCPTEQSQSFKEIAREIKNFWKNRFKDCGLTENDIDIRPWYVIWLFSYQHLDGVLTPQWLTDENNPISERALVNKIKEGIKTINPKFAMLQFSSNNLKDVLNEYFTCKEVFDRKRVYTTPK